MRALRRFFTRLRSWRSSQHAEARLQAEIEDHLDRQTEDYVRAGLSLTEARRQARLKFGGVEAVTEGWREEHGLPVLDTLVQDIRHALRRLRLAPAFTGASILTLGLGIGATTAIFSLVHAVLLKSLPVSDPDQLFRLGEKSRCCYTGGFSQDGGFSIVSYQLYTHLRDSAPGFEELAAFSAGVTPFAVRKVGSADPAESYPAEFVSGNYFAMLGISAYAGRPLTKGDDAPQAPPVAMLSYRLWAERFGADPSIVGSVLTLDGKPFTVVGITPPGFFGDQLRSDPPDFFLPLNAEPVFDDPSDLRRDDTHWLAVIGRLKSATDPEPVQAGMRLELTRWLRSHWGEMDANERARIAEQTLFLRPGGAGITSMREEYRHWLAILMAVTGCALLIVCANLATLMLARGLERRRQTSLTIALGARRARVVREPIIESLLLSVAGGAAGLAIAVAATHAILQMVFPSIPGVGGIPIDASPSTPVLVFAFVMSVGTGLAFGIAPAWMATRVDPIEALRGARGATAERATLPRTVLIVCQAALSLVLLAAAGLLTSALHGLEHQSFGFERDDRIVAHVSAGLSALGQDRLTPLYDRIRESVSQVPGVQGVALANYSPFGNNSWGTAVRVDGRPAPGPHDDVFAYWNRVTPGYFRVIGTPILSGRDISERDTGTALHVAVINEAFARKFFGRENPLGRYFGQHGVGSEREYEVVGVARDAQYFKWDLDKPIGPMFFLPEAQHDRSTSDASADANPGSHYLHDIIVATAPGARVPPATLRQAVASVDAGVPMTSIRSLNAQVSASFSEQRLIARLTSFFAMLSLVLASIGLYGVTAHDAGRRTSEIGVRIALGATRAQVVRLVLGGALTLIGAGLLIGLPLTYVAGRFLGKQLYGTSPFDPAVILTAISSLAIVALVAAWVPAFRASSISPVDALRAD